MYPPHKLEMLSSLDAEAHEVIRRTVRPGDLVVDATAGNGHDTLFLAGLVGPRGRVLAFDIQQDALSITSDRLERSGYLERVQLIHEGHEQLARHLEAAAYPCQGAAASSCQGTAVASCRGVAAAMFNLGFLPGSDKTLTTQAETTLEACKALLPYIVDDGVLSVHAYAGHEGGQREAAALLQWAEQLPWQEWLVRQTSQHNKPKNNECLLLIQRRPTRKKSTPPHSSVPEAPETPWAPSTAAARPSGVLLHSSEERSGGELPRQRVLAVDDAPENLRMVVESLRNEYIMMVATDGQTALKLARSTPQPDVILLDVIMPGINGYEVCSLLKEDPATQNIPILFLTSASESNYEARGLSLGAVDYIHKPFQPELLKTRVRIQTELVRHRTQLEKLVRVRTRELTLTREVTIDTLANLAECRSLETGSHIRRTQHYVRLLAEAMSTVPGYDSMLPPGMIEQLEISAPLHDVGKVGVPDAVLLKPGTLTTEEFEIMKRHTVYGRETMAAAERKLGGHSFLSIAKDIAYSHHERWDGKGYPQGLSQGWIPLSARIMSVADVYDALRSKRVYKASVSHEKAVEALFAGWGTHFDPDVLEAFRQIEMEFHKISTEWAD